MLIRITARFLGVGTFSGHTPSGDAEWPPSPSRVLAALVAGASSERTDACTRGLHALEKAPAPLIIAAGNLTASRKLPHFVPRLNLADPAGTSLDARKRKQLIGARLSSRTQMEAGIGKESTPFGDSVTVTDGVDYLVELPDDTNPEAIQALDDAAGRVCYLGRANDIATLSLTCVPDEDIAEAEGAHGYATALAEASARDVLVPASRGPFTVPGWSEGLVSALDARHDAERVGKHLPHPASSAPAFHYRKALAVTSAEDVVVAHLDQTLTGHRIGALIDAVDSVTRTVLTANASDDAAVQVMIAPGGSEKNRARASHILVSASDMDLRLALMDAVEQATSGLDLEPTWDPAPKMTRRYTGQSTVWTTAAPASAPGPAKYAAAYITAQVARDTETPAELLNISVVRPEGAGSGIHPAATGSRLWDVTVTSQVPLVGPMHVGNTSSGVLVQHYCGNR